MPSKTVGEPDPDVADDVDSADQPSGRLPLFPTVLAAYRLIGEYFVSFVAITVLLAAVHFSLMKLSPLPYGLAHTSILGWLPHTAVSFTAVVVSSAVFAIVCVRWYRRVLAGERYSLRFGPRELQFTVAMVLFYVVLSVPGTLSRTDLGRSVADIAEQIERSTGYPIDLFWPTVSFLWRVSATALLFFTFPAIALDVRQPLAHGVRTARPALPILLLVYLIGLLPWFALDKFGLRPLVLDVNLDRLIFAGTILNIWITTCTFALAGAAYGELADREVARRLSADFD
jgi:hypothetical protein